LRVPYHGGGVRHHRRLDAGGRAVGRRTIGAASVTTETRTARRAACSAALILFGTLVGATAAGADALPIERLTVPAGFRVGVFSDAVPGARSLTRGTGGTVFVGSRVQDVVHALVDADGDGRAERVHTLTGGVKGPNGVAFRDGDLYVAEIERVLRFDDIESTLAHPPAPVVVFDGLPPRRHHGWRYIGFGPDDWLYLGIGAPCNVCKEANPLFASLARMRVDGSPPEVYAGGIRNTVGFDWHPESRELWFTDNGRDYLGDDQPPDELDVATAPGQDFGFPYCHGGDIPDPKFGKDRPCSDFRAPARKLGPHVAALGMRFYTGRMFPERWRGAIFIAEHGSWNRSTPIGYRVTSVRLQNGKAVSYEPFVEGWLDDDDVWGRPVDVLVMPDGALLVSDDKAGAVSRVTYAR
jgi:glucose/arabinose dehydrogenase